MAREMVGEELVAIKKVLKKMNAVALRQPNMSLVIKSGIE